MGANTREPTGQSSGQAGGMQGGQNTTEGVGSPVSNEAYNVIAALHEKLQGLEAYRKYSRDGGECWKQLSDQEQQGVKLLVGELERLVREDKLRFNAPGQSTRPTAKS